MKTPVSVELTYIRQDIGDIKTLLSKINDRIEHYGERISVLEQNEKFLESKVDENKRITFTAIGTSIAALLGFIGQIIWLFITKALK